MAISEEQKAEIKAKVDIADLISSYGFQLKHNGSGLWCCCPFHNEKTPSFKVDSARGTYHCFGCGESGDVFAFVQKQEGLSFVEAMKKLADSVGVVLTDTISPTASRRKRLYALMSALAVDFNRMLKSPKAVEAAAAREYLKSRQITQEVANRFLIGYAPGSIDRILAWANHHGYTKEDLAAAGLIKPSDTVGKPPYFYFANRLMFAIKDKNGQVVAFSGRQLVEDKKSGKYVNSPETLIFKKSRTFFAYDEARKFIVKAPNRQAIVCEGQIDCIRLHANGFQTAVAPLGTAFTEDHAVMLHRVADTALLCFDDDGAGHKATIKAAQLLLAEGMPVKALSLPDGDDPDSYILKHGREAFADLMGTRAESIVQFQIRAERQKEKDPTDTNAVVRVVKAVLETISKSKDKVLRDALLKEAAKSFDMDYATLTDEIAKSVEQEEEASRNADDQLIEAPISGTAHEVSNLPNTTEGALICFIMEHEGNEEIKECLAKLLPTPILLSPLTAKILKAWLKGVDGEVDAIRDTVETLSDEEYRFFVGLMVNLDGTEFSDISPKNKTVYFVRQIWYEFLLHMIVKHRGNREKEKFIANSIKRLHTLTVKGVVHFISTFPYAELL